MSFDIAIMTTVRNDTIFLEKWIDYYANAFGNKHLYVFLDGFDQPEPENADKANIIRLPHKPLERVAAMRRRARIMSHLAQGLHRNYDAVLATDVDEFLMVDPETGTQLKDYLHKRSTSHATLSGLGLDIGQHPDLEAALDPAQPLLAQRRFAHISSRYTKPLVTFKPRIWGSGMHRIKGRNFHIDPNLYVLHTGMIDYKLATGKTMDKDRLATGWGEHLERRERLFKIIKESTPIAGDDYFDRARRLQSWRRPIYAWNKPAMIKGDPVIILPERFRDILI